jgi:hypothetical protein
MGKLMTFMRYGDILPNHNVDLYRTFMGNTVVRFIRKDNDSPRKTLVFSTAFMADIFDFIKSEHPRSSIPIQIESDIQLNMIHIENDCFDIRKYYKADKDFIPTRQGIRLSMTDINNLLLHEFSIMRNISYLDGFICPLIPAAFEIIKRAYIQAEGAIFFTKESLNQFVDEGASLQVLEQLNLKIEALPCNKVIQEVDGVMVYTYVVEFLRTHLFDYCFKYLHL